MGFRLKKLRKVTLQPVVNPINAYQHQKLHGSNGCAWKLLPSGLRLMKELLRDLRLTRISEQQNKIQTKTRLQRYRAHHEIPLRKPFSRNGEARAQSAANSSMNEDEALGPLHTGDLFPWLKCNMNHEPVNTAHSAHRIRYNNGHNIGCLDMQNTILPTFYMPNWTGNIMCSIERTM